MRQIVFDTETTGLEAKDHRIIEIGCVEIVNRRLTKRTLHKYLCPDREIDDGALRVHGITREFLNGQPRFHEVAEELVEFITGAELLIHNAAFDIGFLDMELGRLQVPGRRTAELCRVIDTLQIARQRHPGQRNSLDALCKRYSVDNSNREMHGALLDATLLANVYLAMTGGQGALTLGPADAGQAGALTRAVRPAAPLLVIAASEEELQAHENSLAGIDKASGGKCLWRQVSP